ncbi:uncharacterized protein LOC108738752 [Agrilus planipennis]|uniref:Uncharacterized protein LOC108738752 n=1 Tax=Agrilus planipennis TaxID=224129 RepID=A0A1W4X4T4_AGRPL|nr:uncharacterized protein LOC108738752 [Agrilus planipennis]
MVIVMTPRGLSPLQVRYEMRIADQKECNIISTKCSKMSEETYRRHGTNGSLDGRNVTVKEDCPSTPYNQGGRLKFFKDGKFILELERARDGEKVSWVSVPRKTYWPPQVNAVPTTTYKQESSTSLSVSDDNSSLQSSPWQRDHSWKQVMPRKSLSKEMSFYYWCPKKLSVSKPRSLRRRRVISLDYKNVQNNVSDSKCNIRKVTKQHRVRSLMSVVQSLIDRSVSGGVALTRPETVVSPRKRFLREMEKDKYTTNDACQKRSRNKVVPPVAPGQFSPATTPTSSTNNKLQQSLKGERSSPPTSQANGTSTPEEVRIQKNCSYSITSLLADDRNTHVRGSPDKSPSQFTPVQYRPPSSEDPWYSESVDRLRSIELSRVDKRALSSYPPAYHHFMTPYMYSYPTAPPYYPSNMYSRNYIAPTSYPVAPLPVHLRNSAPSCSWISEARPIKEEYNLNEEYRIKEEDCVEDNLTDMPLNLSKHAS